ncbi:hypothetical protein P4K73_26615, partial [Bacillus cereus]|nr:hypothetical protein [Bacillus cereus]
RKRATVDRRSKEPKNTNQHKNRENCIKWFSRFYVLGSTINVGVFAQKRAKKMHAGSFIHYP